MSAMRTMGMRRARRRTQRVNSLQRDRDACNGSPRM
jgi:hypothetical protein